MATPVNPESKLNGISDIARRHLFAFGMRLAQISQDTNLAANAGEHFSEVAEGMNATLALLSQLQVLDEITRPTGSRGQAAAQRPAERPQEPPQAPLTLPCAQETPPSDQPIYAGRSDAPALPYTNGESR